MKCKVWNVYRIFMVLFFCTAIKSENPLLLATPIKTNLSGEVCNYTQDRLARYCGTIKFCLTHLQQKLSHCRCSHKIHIPLEIDECEILNDRFCIPNDLTYEKSTGCFKINLTKIFLRNGTRYMLSSQFLVLGLSHPSSMYLEFIFEGHIYKDLSREIDPTLGEIYLPFGIKSVDITEMFSPLYYFLIGCVLVLVVLSC